MLVDSHCHLNRLDLRDFNGDLSLVLEKAKTNGVGHFLTVSVEWDDYEVLTKLADQYPEVSISLGVHPDSEKDESLSVEKFCQLATHPACIAFGETGLDYYRVTEDEAQDKQRQRFRTHIQAALRANKPLIIHTRQAAEDTLSIMAEENAQQVGGVMHCFSENLDIALRAIDLGFYISFSGILTFKNATMLQEVARQIPLERILIETDSPYLAPVPYRGKQNHPALVKYVAEALALIRGLSLDEIATKTSDNFFHCFPGAARK
jgi:TatD DNase family protein